MGVGGVPTLDFFPVLDLHKQKGYSKTEDKRNQNQKTLWPLPALPVLQHFNLQKYQLTSTHPVGPFWSWKIKNETRGEPQAV